MLQLVDAEVKLRLDLFRRCGDAKPRTLSPARQALDRAVAMPTPTKNATDSLRLIALVNPADVETAWLDHRKPGHPVTFREAADLPRCAINPS
jgi:hypothetical protein